MKTTLEERSWGTLRDNARDHEWAASCATGGAAVWAGMAVLARMGIARLGAIELLFLFAPLVILPLGMELGRVIGGGGRLEGLARRLQPAGAVLAVLAMWISPGRNAGLAALGWLLICASWREVDSQTLYAHRGQMRTGMSAPHGLCWVSRD